MKVRPYRDSDDVRLREIHASQCLPYDYPELGDEFVSRLVVVDDTDTVVAAALARKTVEIYGMFDTKWSSPAWRFEALRMLHEATRHAVGQQGYHDAHAWIPPSLVKSFARKLRHVFGWEQDPWPSFCRRTGY